MVEVVIRLDNPRAADRIPLELEPVRIYYGLYVSSVTSQSSPISRVNRNVP